MQHPRHLLPDMMVGPWRIKGTLGSGGFGAVFRVEADGRQYALKFAVHGPDSEDLNRTDARARRELACLLLISHPNVVRVWGHGRWPDPRSGFHYVVMDYVEGPTLVDWARHAHPTPRQVLVLFDTLALTLNALHAQGIHHRDLKGTNILVRASDSQPVLVDFGAAEHAAVSSPLTEGPLPPGTPHLRTPEALRFHREQYSDPEARYPFRPTDDLYALGATLYEVLTGAPPFPPHLPRDVLIHQIETKLPASPDSLNPSVPPALAEVVLRLLAKRPEERPESGRALHEQFQALLSANAPALDLPLLPGADTVTTEGTGAGPPVAPSAPSPERPPPGTADRGGTQAWPALPSLPSEASAPTVALERAAPGAPRRWRWGLAAGGALAALGLLAVLLGRGGGGDTGSSSGASSPSASSSSAIALLADAGTSPPSSTPTPEDGASETFGASLASAAPDGGPGPLAQGLPPTPQQKGPSLMRPNTPAKHAPPPQEPEKSRGASARPAPQEPDKPLAASASPPPQEPEKARGTSSPRKIAGVVAACTLATGCSSAEPAVRPGPPPKQLCPPGAAEAMRKELGILEPVLHEVSMPGNAKGDQWRDEDLVLLRAGRNEVTTLEQFRWKKTPKGTAIIGDFFISDKVYARFTEVRLPNGRRLPFCGHLVAYDGNKDGEPFQPGPRPGEVLVFPVSYVAPDFEEH